MKINPDMSLYHLNQAKAKAKMGSTSKVNEEEITAYNKRLKSACDGFEEIFVHKMIQVMRSTTDKDTLLYGGRGEEIFQDMLDENYAKLITQSKALGLSDLIYEQTKKS
ncbi:MAG: rod-binding protein [Proteobacteria bacterium]|nr:rod-binding protein [Pseudomonadota bacterium]